MTSIKKAQTGAAVKKTVIKAKAKVKPAAKKLKEAPEEWKYKNLSKTETATAQVGKSIKKAPASKARINMAVPGMGLPSGNPKKVETASAKTGKSVKKYQMGGYVSNEFAAKTAFKAKPKTKTKFVDSEIKTKKGKDIYAFEGKKGMLAKSGAKLKNK
jgi:hypothetical protein